ncbi:MAG: DUF2079 domain-containing protein [Candidatus Altiarchaeota archaeon]
MILALMIGLYLLVFCFTVLNQYNMFWYGNFDLGIPDQGIWLLSRFKTPYLTTRGLHFFGDHTSFIHIFVAPLYWLWNDVRALILLHTLVLAAGAIPVYLIARDKFDSYWIPLVFSFAYIFYPAVHYSNLDQGYHYESFMVPLTLFGYWFLMHRRFRAYYAMYFFSLICKEEISFSYILFGIYIFFKIDKRVGAVTTATSLIWVLLVMHVFFPYFNTEGAFYTGRTLGSFGKTTMDKVKSLTNPFFMFNKVVTAKNYKYFMDVLFPTGFLFFLDLPSMAAAASLYLNLITDWSYAHEIRFHYVTPIIPFVFISIINGVARYKSRKWSVYGLLLVLVVFTLIGNEEIGPGEAKISNYEMTWDTITKLGRPHGEYAEVLELMELIPEDARVSASYNFVSHLTHRERVYMFPNPFRVNLYGIKDSGVHPDTDVDFVLLDTRLVRNELESVYTVNESGDYEIIDERRYAQLFRHVNYTSTL